jgi:hypothetical protein
MREGVGARRDSEEGALIIYDEGRGGDNARDGQARKMASPLEPDFIVVCFFTKPNGFFEPVGVSLS